MRRAPFALFSGIGRRVAWTVIAAGIAVLALALLLQAGKQQRQYRDMHQAQLRVAASHAALTVQSRIGDADALLRALADASPDESAGDWAGLRARLRQAPPFDAAVLVEATEDALLTVGTRQFVLGEHERDALESGRTVLVGSPQAGRPPTLFLLRALQEPQPARWVLAELHADWLWSGMAAVAGGTRLVALDAAGRELFATVPGAGAAVTHVAQQLSASPAGEDAASLTDIAFSELGDAWVGALARIDTAGIAAGQPLALVATARDRPWSTAFWSALRTQGTMLPVLLLLAALAAHRMAGGNLLALRQLRRALAQLPERRVPVSVQAGQLPEVRQVVEAFNRTAEAIEAQSETRRALDEIDALLLPGGDYESVIDQVLIRVRRVTAAHDVGLTLVDPGVAGHGRLFAVNADGGFPVNRVMLDEEMVATLCDAEQGMTIVRCEPGRHSFLEPLQSAGSNFFWVWPVMVAGDLMAILAVGYVEPPAQGARVARSGTQCAQRLSMSLSSNARAERLYRQAHFDPLTQLPNRALFRDQLEQALREATQAGRAGALLYIDLDHFKKVNDSLGHEAGDQLLSIVAQRLRACVKDADTVARLGGDEFTVILRDVEEAAAVSAVAERIIEAMQSPVRIGGRDHLVQASIGITLFPSDGGTIEELLRNADLAMYRAKDLGRGGCAFYSPKLVARGTRIADSGLYRAMKRREFSLYFQPQYRVADGALVGLEVLLRWQKPRDGLLVSADFIPAAEECGLIVDLGGWVIEAACAQIAQWRELGVTVPRVAVNLSVQQLRDPELVNTLRRHLERHRVSPAALEFEVNEAALTDPDSQGNIEALSALGTGLTLDDFGTGNTALANLRRYPVSAVKIDRSFVDRLSDDTSAAALASTIIVMAHALDKLVIAEGVETIEQLDYLRERGCDAAQGFFMARPLSASDMTDLLIGRREDQAAVRSAIA